jgi:hypothetical protein
MVILNETFWQISQNKTCKIWNPQKINWFEFLSFCIAIGAFLISLDANQQTRLHNRLSVQPNIEFIKDEKDSLIQGIYITNNGLGPANIKSIDCILGAEIWAFTCGSNGTLFTPPGTIDSIIHLSQLPNGSHVIAANDKHYLFCAYKADLNTPERKNKYDSLINQVFFSSGYTSFYNERDCKKAEIGPSPSDYTSRIAKEFSIDMKELKDTQGIDDTF